MKIDKEASSALNEALRVLHRAERHYEGLIALFNENRTRLTHDEWETLKATVEYVSTVREVLQSVRAGKPL